MEGIYLKPCIVAERPTGIYFNTSAIVERGTLDLSEDTKNLLGQFHLSQRMKMKTLKSVQQLCYKTSCKLELAVPTSVTVCDLNGS